METKSTKKQTTETSESKTQTCGLIMPISTTDNCSAEHWKEVKSIIEDSIKTTGMTPKLVSDADDSGVIQKRIVQNIYNNELVVCDVSCKNPNVMFELGMRLAFDKPTIIIMDDKTSYSFDTNIIEHLSYPRDLRYNTIIEFKEKLADKIKGTLHASKQKDYTTFLKHFGEFKVAEIEKKDGSLNDVILDQLQHLSSQISYLQRQRNANTEESIEITELINKIVRDGVVKYCAENNIEESVIDDNTSNEKEDLYDYLSKNEGVRLVCGAPNRLRKAIDANVYPF